MSTPEVNGYALSLDLAEPAVRAAISLRRSGAGTVRWFEMGDAAGSIGYAWNHISRRLTLSGMIDGVVVRQVVAVTVTNPYFGGVRPWFVCPLSGTRTRVLLLAPGRRQWSSRAALGLSYPSQRLSPDQRRWRRWLAGAEAGVRRNTMRRMLRRRARTG